VFLAPIGFLNAPRAMGKSLTHDPERALLVRRAFEDYATGRYTKEQLLTQARASGLTNRRGRPLTSQAIGVLRRNRTQTCKNHGPTVDVDFRLGPPNGLRCRMIG
jgi:hypothetical protein